jgi:hypothetical protein
MTCFRYQLGYKDVEWDRVAGNALHRDSLESAVEQFGVHVREVSMLDEKHEVQVLLDGPANLPSTTVGDAISAATGGTVTAMTPLPSPPDPLTPCMEHGLVNCPYH